MKKKLLYIAFLLMIILTVIPTTAFADVGPKPSVEIKFEGLENEKYFVTLLSDVPSTGPYHINEYFDSNNYEEMKGNYWQAFLSFQDKDGFYYLQYAKECTETSKFIWGYRPPQKFKILIYFPDYDCIMVSEEIYKRYSLHNYYKVNAKGLNLKSLGSSGTIKAERVYDYTAETFSLVFRMLVTILIEVLIAYIFRYKEKKQLFTIVILNIITQLILNALLNVFNYDQNDTMFILYYVFLELLVIGIESVAYTIYLPKYGKGKTTGKWRAAKYAVTANAMSFGCGLFLAKLLPGLF